MSQSRYSWWGGRPARPTLHRGAPSDKAAQDADVKTVRVFGDCYRCNWWVREKGSAPVFLEFSTGRISKSRMLRVTREADRLVITDLSKRD